MSSKEIKFGKDARDIILRGIEKTAGAVGATLGAAGRNVVIAQEQGIPLNTKDGVTVARHISLEDEGENQGCLMVKEAAARTVGEAGDGTTTSSVLLSKMCSLINSAIKTEGDNVTLIKRGMEDALEKAKKVLSEISLPATEQKDLVRIATISANNDPHLGELIGDAYFMVGKDGEVAYEFSNSDKTETLMVEGMKIGSGLTHPAFVNNPSSLTFQAKGCYVLVSDKQISNWQEISPVLESLVMQTDSGTPNILFLAPLDHDAFAFVLQNVAEGKINAAIVFPPESSDLRKEICQDIASFCGGIFHSKDAGNKIDGDLSRLGYVESVTIDQKNTILTAGHGSAEDRIQYLRSTLNADIGVSQRHQIEQRIARLSGKHALIKVGGQTQSSTLERADRVDDAIHATKAAMQEGYVAGCGTAYYHIAEKIIDIGSSNQSPSFVAGFCIVADALAYPMQKNLTNGGLSFAPGNFQYGKGYNMLTAEYCNLFEDGIIDPAKVVRVAMENAVAVASLFLITECLITHTEKPNERNSGKGQ